MKLIKKMVIALFLLWCWSVISINNSSADVDHFPVYPCIESNVKFWVKVYTEEPSNRGIIHDSNDLDIIYEVIDVKKQEEPGAEDFNKKRIRAVKEKYEKMLESFACGRSPTTDAEKRVYGLFGRNPERSVLREARNNIRFQRGQKDRFLPGLIRSGAYLEEMKKILRDYGLPTDLAYLPHVESSFNYEAYSKFGAAGVWQFTRETGKRFLTVDYTLDERRDPISSTHAAARFLKENYETLGSWPLALTAYNHGTAGMVRAKKAKGCYESIFKEYDGQRFKFASRNFYSEFLAARKVAKNYQSYFGQVQLDSPKQTCEYKVPGYAPIHNLAKHVGVDLATIRELNPTLRPPVYTGQKYVPKGYSLRLPGRKDGKAAKQFASIIREDLFVSGQKPSRFYRVRRGDTASEIARLQGVSLKDLIFANQLDKWASIYEGQNLRIPLPGEGTITLAKASKKSSLDGVQVAAAKQSAVDLREAPVVAKGVSKAVKSEETQSVESTERETGALELPAKELPASGEISRELPALEVAALETSEVEPPSSIEPAKDQETKEMIVLKPAEQEFSEPEPALIEQEDTFQTSVAMEMPVIMETEINPAVVTGHLQVEKLIKAKGKTLGVIRVEAEETLGHYAEWLGVSAQEIRRLNGLSFRKGIQIDQSLKVPLEKIGAVEFEEKRYEYHKEVEEDFYAAYRVQGVQLYEIRKGDNIWKLCSMEFDTPFWLVKKYNPSINFNGLMPDQKIRIPVVEAPSES